MAKKDELTAGFENTLLSMLQSHVFGQYCLDVYGYPIKLLSMLTSKDIEELADYVQYEKPQKILELGCGTGELLKCLSTHSNGLFWGLENSEKVTRYLNDHNQTQNLKFILGDIDTFVAHEQTYDLILVIDSLYFVDDLETSIGNILSSLSPEGTAIIYYSEYQSTAQNDTWKDANNNNVGRILRKYNTVYEIKEITERELLCWQHIETFGNIYKSAFEKEGNIISIEENIEEAKNISAILQAKSGKRFKYTVHHG